MSDVELDEGYLSRIFKVLRSEERREILYSMNELEDTFRDDELVDVLDEEFDRERENLEISLHQEHLPMLTQTGVIQYHKDLSLVTYDDDEILKEMIETVHKYVKEEY